MAQAIRLPNPNKFRVRKPNQQEGLKSSLYDFQAYAAAGQTSLSFFQIPIGQSSKTIYDTNMKAAGQLSAGNRFVIDSIEIYLFPGLSPGLNGTADAATNFTNDVYAIGKSGTLTLQILDKIQVQESPLMRFPPKTGLMVSAAYALDVVEATAEAQTSMDYARFAGKPYNLNPPVTLDENTAFNVTMTWPTVVATPSTVAARIGVVMEGTLYRDVQ